MMKICSTMDEEYQTIFSEKRVASMLLFFYDVHRAKESDLTHIVSNYDQSVAVAKKLLDAGLIKTWTDHESYVTKWYELTDLGYEVSKFIKSATDCTKRTLKDNNLKSSSEKQDVISNKSIGHSVQSPTLIKILVTVQNSPGITISELTKVFDEEDLYKTIHDAENEKYIFECDMDRSDVKSGYYLTAKGVDLIGSRTFSKNVGDVIEMDCNASSSEENMAKK